MSLEYTGLTNCSECGRLMAKKEGETLCSRCLEKQKPATIPTKEFTEQKIIIAPDNKEKIFQEKIVSHEEEKKVSIRVCSVCKKRNTLPNRDLCLSCALDMYKGFQNITEEILSEKQKPPKPTLIETYASTRQMEPFRRIRTQGLTWVKRYNLH